MVTRTKLNGRINPCHCCAKDYLPIGKLYCSRTCEAVGKMRGSLIDWRMPGGVLPKWMRD